MHSLTNPDTKFVAKNESQEWKVWARGLQKWGLSSLVSALLESSGAFATLAAQSLYVGQPFLESLLPVRSLTQILEDPEQTQAFAKFLREESQ